MRKRKTSKKLKLKKVLVPCKLHKTAQQHSARRTKKVKIVFVCRMGYTSAEDSDSLRKLLARKGLSKRFEVRFVALGDERLTSIRRGFRGADIVVSPYFNLPPRNKDRSLLRRLVKKHLPKARMLKYAEKSAGNIDTEKTFSLVMKVALKQKRSTHKGKLSKRDLKQL